MCVPSVYVLASRDFLPAMFTLAQGAGIAGLAVIGSATRYKNNIQPS